LHIALQHYTTSGSSDYANSIQDHAGCVDFLFTFCSGSIRNLRSYGHNYVSFVRVLETHSPNIISSFIAELIETDLVHRGNNDTVFNQLAGTYTSLNESDLNTEKMKIAWESNLKNPQELDAVSYFVIKSCYDMENYKILNQFIIDGFRTSPNVYLKNELNLLMRAVSDNNIDALKSILEDCGDSIDIESTYKEGAEDGNEKNAWIFENYDMDMDTAASLATNLGHRKCLKLLLDAGAMCFSDKWNLLHISMGVSISSEDDSDEEVADEEVAEMILNRRLLDTGSLHKSLGVAVSSGNAEYVKMFIGACKSQNVLASEELADISGIMTAGVIIGDQGVVSQLIELATDFPDMVVFSSAFHVPMTSVTKSSNKEQRDRTMSCIRLIMDSKVGVLSIDDALPVDVKRRNHERLPIDQFTPLMSAVKKNDLEYCRLLLECKNINIADTTPLAMKYTDDSEFVKTLVNRGCNATLSDLVIAFTYQMSTPNRNAEEKLNPEEKRKDLVDFLLQNLLQQYSSSQECFADILDTVASLTPLEGLAHGHMSRSTRETPLLLLEFVQDLITKGARCNIISRDGSTGLLRGVNPKRTQWDKLMLTIISVMDRAYLDVKNEQQKTAFEIWYGRKQYNLCASALARGATVDVPPLDTDAYVAKVVDCFNPEETPPELYVQYVLTDLPYELVVKDGANSIKSRAHNFSLTRFLAKESGYKIPADIQLKIATEVLEYCHQQDSRWAVSLVRYTEKNCKALPEVESLMKSYVLFCGRFDLQPGPPMHRSATAVVLMAEDKGRDRYFKTKFLEHCLSSDSGNCLSLTAFVECLTAMSCSVITGNRSASAAEILSECDKLYQKYKNQDSLFQLANFQTFCEDHLPSSVKVAIKLMTDKVSSSVCIYLLLSCL
jgi:hypothetical protein